jgi:PAT family beta-lactamase induction signal transducer AmpG
MLVCSLMGFSCGLPLTLTMGLAQAWMKQAMVSLGVIGLITLVQMPYAVKFLWAPLFDRYTPPFLGRRRGWLFITQALLVVAIAAMGLADPALSPWLLGAAALLVAVFSASQDSVVDAYRREDLADEELGLGSTLYAYGYRLGTLLAGGGGLILADHLGFAPVYALMSAFMLVGLVTTLFTPEPVVSAGKPVSIKEAVVETFTEFFHRSGTAWAVMVLAFILLYSWATLWPRP